MENPVYCSLCRTRIRSNAPYCPHCQKLVHQTQSKTDLHIRTYREYFGNGINPVHIHQECRSLFDHDELLIGAFAGSDEDVRESRHYLIVTNHRVIFWSCGNEGVHKSFNFEEIGSVEEMLSLAANSLELNIGGRRECFPNMNRDELSLATTIIRQRIQLFTIGCKKDLPCAGP